MGLPGGAHHTAGIVYLESVKLRTMHTACVAGLVWIPLVMSAHDLIDFMEAISCRLREATLTCNPRRAAPPGGKQVSATGGGTPGRTAPRDAAACTARICGRPPPGASRHAVQRC